MTIPNGGLITLAVLLPNILFLVFPPDPAIEPKNETKSRIDRLAEITEGVGRMAVFILPCLYEIGIYGKMGAVGLAVMSVSLAFYYVGWLRYIIRKRHPAWLYKPMLGIPQPMAVSPTLYFLAASLVVHSYYLAIAALIFGIAHIYISQEDYKRSLRNGI